MASKGHPSSMSPQFAVDGIDDRRHRARSADRAALQETPSARQGRDHVMALACRCSPLMRRELCGIRIGFREGNRGGPIGVAIQ